MNALPGWNITRNDGHPIQVLGSLLFVINVVAFVKCLLDVCIVRSVSHELIVCGGDAEDALRHITRLSLFPMYSNGSYRR